MNTVRSTWYGWATLCVAGGGAYYFAKREINKDRQSRYEEEMKKQNRLKNLERSAYARGGQETSSIKSRRQPASSESSAHETRGLDHAGSPSSEISEDAAPVGHAPVDGEQRTREKSKYEAAEPYRSRKGDRFS
ncbi:hypothetical protein H2198_001898 [Neophaeococcomyces mojaviensis]|uniref:Uncharacterized protein n=1 Tax=Neophaeococcomyces mojaviensis TaxID=3383035 RepID=A0ACC3AG55_9EURO|nr:hypothetical protein H2198_001898 [Knufia sp. JES_112]